MPTGNLLFVPVNQANTKESLVGLPTDIGEELKNEVELIIIPQYDFSKLTNVRIMPRRARLSMPGIPWYVIKCGNNLSACFYSDDDYQLYLRHLKEQAEKYDCKFTLMY